MFIVNNIHAFTIKSGQVWSSDGNVYDFASPDEKKKLIEKYKNGGDQVGVLNNQLFIVMDEDIINIPMSDLQGKSDSEIDTVLDKAFADFENKEPKEKEPPKQEINKPVSEMTEDELIEKIKNTSSEDGMVAVMIEGELVFVPLNKIIGEDNQKAEKVLGKTFELIGRDVDEVKDQIKKDAKEKANEAAKEIAKNQAKEEAKEQAKEVVKKNEFSCMTTAYDSEGNRIADVPSPC